MDNLKIADDPFEEPVSMDSQSDRKKKLAAWVMNHVENWRDYRDSNYKDRWDEYYRLWRGVWMEGDKTRSSERSRLIAPAIQQAVEVSVAEKEEAVFGKGRWFDVDEDIRDQTPEDLANLREQLWEDFNYANINGSLSEIFLNGALYGTGIGKIIVEEREEKDILPVPDEFGMPNPQVQTLNRFTVRLEAVSPRDFLIEPSARTIEESLGVAHEVIKPLHDIKKKQKSGVYIDTPLGTASSEEDVSGLGEMSSGKTDDKVAILEYHGLVPTSLLPDGEGEKDDFKMTEALITIGNSSVILKEVANPLIMQDRGFLAYQEDTVPHRFWGRGVVEKGYNPQKALDAELRARIDGLALTVHPMMAGDATRLPRGMNLQVRPGKQILTQGDPRNILMPFNFGTIDNNTFSNAADLERMIQMGTGAMDSATPTGINARNNTASGMSMMLSGAIKRSKRTLNNISRKMLSPFVQKALWRYIQFDRDAYPIFDYKFQIVSTMGIMAREVEQMQLSQLLQTVPPGTPEFYMILKNVFENSSITNKEKVQELLNEHMKPKEPQVDPMVQMKQMEIQVSAQRDQHNQQVEEARLQIEQQRVMDNQRKIQLEERKQLFAEEVAKLEVRETEAKTILALAKAESENLGTNLEAYRIQIEEMRAANDIAVSRINAEREAQEQRDSERDNQYIHALEALESKLNAATEKNEKAFKSLMERKPENITNNIERPAQQMTLDLSGIEKKIDSLSKSMNQKDKPKKITRDSNGMVTHVNGRKVKRNADGLIEEA